MAGEKTSDEGAAEKAGQWVAELAEKVMVNGVGPITGSATWAEDRLSRRQGADYRAPGDDERSRRRGGPSPVMVDTR